MTLFGPKEPRLHSTTLAAPAHPLRNKSKQRCLQIVRSPLGLHVSLSYLCHHDHSCRKRGPGWLSLRGFFRLPSVVCLTAWGSGVEFPCVAEDADTATTVEAVP